MSDAAARGDRLTLTSSWIFQSARPKRLGVAVSGGGDSMALLSLMAAASVRFGVPVEAVTVDHGLRPEAAEEAKRVAEHCAARDIAHETLRWEGAAGGNLSEKAREGRYALIGGWAVRRGVDLVVLGHTRDDQAENFLLRLRRAAGVDGLATMARQFEAHGTRWARPLLDIGRNDLRQYLRDNGIAWSEDPTNEDPAYERARARQILEALRPLGLDSTALARTSHNMRMARTALDHYAWREAQARTRTEGGDLLIRRGPVPPEPPIPAEIARRLLVRGIQWMTGAPHGPRATALAGMEPALHSGGAFAVAGCIVTRPGDDELRITREWRAVRDLAAPTDALWDGRWRLSGPHAPDLEIRALGEAVTECPDWRETRVPRRSLLASPAVWRGNALVSAPLAGFFNGWSAELAETRRDFARFLLSR